MTQPTSFSFSADANPASAPTSDHDIAGNQLDGATLTNQALYTLLKTASVGADTRDVFMANVKDRLKSYAGKDWRIEITFVPSFIGQLWTVIDGDNWAFSQLSKGEGDAISKDNFIFAFCAWS